MDNQQRIATCIRVAAEYRAVSTVSTAAILDQEFSAREMTFRSAFPDRWGPSAGKALGQALLLTLTIPFTALVVLVIDPISRHRRKTRAHLNALQLGEQLSDRSIQTLAERIGRVDLAQLWTDHGLPEKRSSATFDQRAECLERWVNTLYGNGVAVASRVRVRAKELRKRQAAASANFSMAGGSISFVDPIDALVAELASELPTVGESAEIKPLPHGPYQAALDEAEEYAKQFDALAERALAGPDDVRRAAGEAIRKAGTHFRKHFVTTIDFVKKPNAEQKEYLTMLSTLEETLMKEKENPGSATGVGLFKMWLGAVYVKDAQMQRDLWRTLSKLTWGDRERPDSPGRSE